MRIAALAFGVLAGLIASLILALGGLDVAPLSGAAARQISLIRFGLFVVANIGVFAAGIALVAPLTAAIMMLIGAASWVAAALLLGHGADLVLGTPPGLLVIGAAIAIVAHFRSPRLSRLEDDDQDEPMSRRLGEPGAPEADEFDERPPTAVAAGFLGQSSASAFARGEPERAPAPPARNQLRAEPATDWEPQRRRQPPPRTRSMFRAPDADDEDDEPSGLWRLARGASGLLSIGLYAAVIGAAILVFWNIRGDAHPADTTKLAIRASSALPLVIASSVAALPGAGEPSSLPSLPAASSAPASAAAVSAAPDTQPTSSALDTSASADRLTTAPALAIAATDTSASSAEPSEAASDASSAPLPLDMPSSIAAARARRASSSAAETRDTGL